jgi:hypothetical protein
MERLGPWAWLAGLLASLAALLEAALRWRIDTMLTFGWVQWGMLAVVVLMLGLAEWRARQLLRANQTLIETNLLLLQTGIEGIVRRIEAGQLSNTPALRRELQRTIDQLVEAGGQPQELANSLLDKLNALLDQERK